MVQRMDPHTPPPIVVNPNVGGAQPTTGKPGASALPTTPLSQAIGGHGIPRPPTSLPANYPGVFMGWMPKQVQYTENIGPAATGGVMTAFQAQGRPLADSWGAYTQLNEADSKRLAAVLDARYPNGWDGSYLGGVWAEGVQEASYQNAQGVAVTPLQVLEDYWVKGPDAAQHRSAGGGSGGGGAAFGGTTVATNLTDPDTANALANQTLQQYLGKMANPKEQATFRKALLAHEMANPSISTVTGSSGAAQQLQHGGSNAQQFAAEWGASRQGSAEFQAATTYLDAFNSALGNPTGQI